MPRPPTRPDLDEIAARRAKRGQERLGLAARAPPRRALGADDAEHAAVLGERPLAEQVAGDPAAAAVVRLHRARDVELVDLGLRARLLLGRLVRIRPVGPALGRDVEALRRRVDDPAVRHHRGRVDRLQALRQVDGEDGEHAEAGERRRAADVAALDERARLAGLRACALDPVGREPARDLRAREHGLVLPLGGGDRLRRAVGGLLERERGRQLGGHDDPGGRADEPRGDVGAVERERADEPQLGRVGHVNLGEDGVGRLVGGDAGGHRGQRLDPVAAAREHEQPVAVQEQLVAQPRLERERVEQPRLRTGDVDRAQLPVRDGEDRVPVRLDEVRLVDAFLLHVRAGEVDALDGSGRGGAGDRRRRLGRHRAADRAEAVRADEPLRLPLRVAEQLAAGAERGQLRLRRLWSRASRRACQGDGRGGRQHDQREASSELHHPGYTPPKQQSSHPKVWRSASREH